MDRERVVRLPDISGLKHRVVMQRGHDCNFGAQVSQMIRLAGATLDLIGTAERCSTTTCGIRCAATSRRRSMWCRIIPRRPA